jgi:hypothetical protein
MLLFGKNEHGLRSSSVLLLLLRSATPLFRISFDVDGLSIRIWH